MSCYAHRKQNKVSSQETGRIKEEEESKEESKKENVLLLIHLEHH